MCGCFDTTRLTIAEGKLEDIKEVAKDGLNADSGDAEREALAEIADIVGLTMTWDDEEDIGRYE